LVRIIIGITGTPGTGKKSVGKLLARNLNYELVDINSFVKGEEILKREINNYLKDKRAVVIGHLLPYVLDKRGIRLIVVLRCHPYELAKRLEKRGYDPLKVKENVSAEILGIVLYDTVKKFGKGKVCEIDTTNRKEEEVVKDIMDLLEYRKRKVLGLIDWLSLVEKDEGLLKFLQV